MLTHQVLALPIAALAGLVVALTFGGVVKGVTGVGLPIVLVPLIAQLLPLTSTISLLSVSMVASNITQAAEGGGNLAAIRALWPTLLALIAGTVLGVHLLIAIDRRLLSLILGISFLALSALLLGMERVRLRLNSPVAAHGGPVVGFAAGVLGGMSAMFGPPMIAYLIALRTAPDIFVKQMAIFALTAAATMLLTLGGSGALSGTDYVVALVALAPIQAGMPLGRWLRRRIRPDLFRLAVLAILAAGGIDQLHRAFL